MQETKVRFYQTGTFTVGNRLLDEAARTVQSSMERFNALNSGHRACQGCGEALGARYALDAAMEATKRRLIACNATGCLEVFSTPYPESAWQMPWFHSLFGNTAAVATGMAAAARVKARKRALHPTGCSQWVATAVRPTSVSGVCRGCLSVTTMCSTSALTMRPI